MIKFISGSYFSFSIVIISIGLLFVFSCKKSEEKSSEKQLSVTVLDEVTGSPVQNASVTAYFRDAQGQSGLSGSANGLTDASGKAYILYSAEWVYLEDMRVEKSDYPNQCSFTFLQTIPATYEVHLMKNGILKLRLLNQAPVNATDNFLVNFGSGSCNSITSCEVLPGASNDTTFYINVLSGSDYVTCYLKNNGVLINDSSFTLTVQSVDTTNLQINY